MRKTLIAMTSITYAMKAKGLLNSMGIYCEVEKTPKNVGTGCGYSIRVREAPDAVIGILDANNIPHYAAYEF